MLLFSHLIAAGQEHGFSVMNPAFEQYARYFPSTSRNLVPRFPAGRPLLAAPGIVRKVSYRAAHAGADVVWRLQQRGRDVGMIRLTRDQEVDLNSDFFVGMARRHRVLFIQDWFFRNQENVARHAGLLRCLLHPAPRPARARTLPRSNRHARAGGW